MMSENQQEYKIVDNYLMFKEIGSDAAGINHRAGEINAEERKAEKHSLITEVYPFLCSSPSVWKRVNILLEGVRKSNIPKLYSPEKIIKEEDKAYLVYPYIRGRTFEQVLDDCTQKDMPINFDLAFSIVFAIADLIDVGSSIVVSGEKSFHGFLTPDNIIIDYDGKVYLKNYGIYPYLSREEEVFTEMEKKYGAWIAPEFQRKEKLVSQTDIYHLGYITYRILTGKYFSFTPGEDFDSKFSNISFVQHMPSSDKKFLTNLLTFFKKTLHPTPAKRFENIKELKDFISTEFQIEELSSVTFNLAYFMNSLYLELIEEEKKVLEEELAYTLPEEKKEEPEPVEKAKGDDHLVEDILTGLDEHKKSRVRLFVPVIAIVVIVVIATIFIVINQQKQVKRQQEQQVKTTEDLKRTMEQFKSELELEYQKKLKTIEERATTTEDEKKAQEEEIRRLREWQKEETRKVLEKQKLEEERLAKLQQEEQAKEEQKKKDEEAARQAKLAEEQKKKEAARKAQVEKQRKKIEETQTVKQGQLISLVEATKKPEKVKGKNPVFSPILKRKYKGQEMTVRTVLLIDEKGNVINVRVLGQTPDDLKFVITRSFKRWKYSPAQKDGVRVKVWQPVSIRIKL
jgi:serine/threonine protein kinase